MKHRLTIAILAILAIFSAKAINPQSDIENFDHHRWDSETMVFASVVVDGDAADMLTLFAYIDDELRGYATAPESFVLGSVYALRVKGDTDDIGKVIKVVALHNSSGEIYAYPELVTSQQLIWSGETIGVPSAPVVISLTLGVRPTQIVTVKDYTFYRQDYNAEHPLLLTPLYTVLPDNATNKSVDMELTAATKRKGSLVRRDDQWVFVPSASCAGDVDIRILSSVDHMVGALLTIEALVHAEAIELHTTSAALEVGEEMDITPFFDVLPADANDKSVSVTAQDHIEVVPQPDGSYTLRGLSEGTDEVTITLNDNPAVSATLTVTVRPVVDAIEVSMNINDDDIVDDTGNVLAYRQEIMSPRVFTAVSIPAGAKINADNIFWIVTRSGADCPDDWDEYQIQVANDTDGALTFDIIPLVPGHYMITCLYKGVIVSDAQDNTIVWSFDAVLATDLTAGWNWFGSAATQHGSKLSEALADKNTLVEARTQRSFLINDPELGYVMGFADPQGKWTNDFTLDAARDNGHFRIKLANTADTPTRLIYDGDYDLMNAKWELTEGWNWVNSPAIYPCPITAINDFGIFNENDIIKSRDYVSVFTYYGWEGTLQYLEPGEAYALYTSHSGKIDIDISQIDQPYYIGSTAAKPKPTDYDPYRFMDNMAIIAEIDDVDGNDCSLKVFSGNECRGEGRYVNDRWYIVAHGETDDVFTFAIQDNHTGDFSYIDSKIGFSDMAGTYTTPVRMSLSDKSHPVIYASGSTIVGADRIYDMQGRDITAANGCLISGTYIAIADGWTCKVVVK